MDTQEITINSGFCFSFEKGLTADISNQALRKFADEFEMAKNLQGQYPIFLDANILLTYYKISEKEKKKILDFIEKYKDRIHITKQIEQEFLRNRLSVLEKDFWVPLNSINSNFEDLKNSILRKLKSFRENQQSILSDDHPELWEKISLTEKKIANLLNDKKLKEDLEAKVDSIKSSNKFISFVDHLLQTVGTLNCTNELTKEEVKFIEQQFNQQLTNYKALPSRTKWKFAFPGCGERKENKAGDFIIFHEMLKFIKEQNKSCIFLTGDTKKGDWIQTDKKQHCHYIEHAYDKTGNIIFIIHAEDFFPNISFYNASENEGNPELVKTDNNLVGKATTNKKGGNPSTAYDSKQHD